MGGKDTIKLFFSEFYSIKIIPQLKTGLIF